MMKASSRLVTGVTSGFLYFITNHILTIVLPFYFIAMGGSEINLGIAVSIMGFTAILARPAIGVLLDKWKLQTFTFVTIVLMLLQSIAYLLVNNVVFLTVLRGIHGISFAMFIMAYLLEISRIFPDTNNKRRAISISGMAMPFSMAFSPIIGSIIYENFGIKFVFLLIVLVTSICSLLLIAITVQTTENKLIPQLQNILSEESVVKNNDDLTIKQILPIFVAYIFLGSIDMLILNFIPLYGKLVNVSYTQYFLLFAITMMLAQVVIIPLINKYEEKPVLIFGYALLGVSIFVLVLKPCSFIFTISAILFGMGFAAVETTSNSIVLLFVNKKHRGRFLGMLQIFSGLGRTITPIFSAFIIMKSTYTTLFFIFSCFSLLAVVCAFFYRKV